MSESVGFILMKRRRRSARRRTCGRHCRSTAAVSPRVTRWLRWLRKSGRIFSMKNIVLLTALAACALSANASEYFVATNGCDEADGSATSPWRTIQRAADVAVAGDVVTIRGGTYREWVKPANAGREGAPITYQAAKGEKVVVTGADPVRLVQCAGRLPLAFVDDPKRQGAHHAFSAALLGPKRARRKARRERGGHIRRFAEDFGVWKKERGAAARVPRPRPLHEGIPDAHVSDVLRKIGC